MCHGGGEGGDIPAVPVAPVCPLPARRPGKRPRWRGSGWRSSAGSPRPLPTGGGRCSHHRCPRGICCGGHTGIGVAVPKVSLHCIAFAVAPQWGTAQGTQRRLPPKWSPQVCHRPPMAPQRGTARRDTVVAVPKAPPCPPRIALQWSTARRDTVAAVRKAKSSRMAHSPCSCMGTVGDRGHLGGREDAAVPPRPHRGTHLGTARLPVPGRSGSQRRRMVVARPPAQDCVTSPDLRRPKGVQRIPAVPSPPPRPPPTSAHLKKKTTSGSSGLAGGNSSGGAATPSSAELTVTPAVALR